MKLNSLIISLLIRLLSDLHTRTQELLFFRQLITVLYPQVCVSQRAPNRVQPARDGEQRRIRQHVKSSHAQGQHRVSCVIEDQGGGLGKWQVPFSKEVNTDLRSTISILAKLLNGMRGNSSICWQLNVKCLRLNRHNSFDVRTRPPLASAYH